MSEAINSQQQSDELSDQSLEAVAGGQGPQVIALPKVVVVGHRESAGTANLKVVELERVTVTAKRDQSQSAGLQVASASRHDTKS